MGNIIGEPTPSYVVSQVNKRQEIHGSLARSNDELNYLNSKTAFVKLASSVYVEDTIPNEDIKNTGLLGNQLAEKYVLFNGVTDEKTNTQRSGIARDKSIDNTNAYGVGGLEFGLSPMMGITSVNVSSKNRGSLRTATVEIIANNRIQFEIIDTLYIKLGYFMLLEWGWTNYYTSTEYIKDNPHSLVDDFLLRNSSYDELLLKIEEKRKASEGNYDALVGKVVNFNWTFTPDGKYQITLNLISQGDVIDSLKVNVLLPDDAKSTKKEEATSKDKEESTDEEKPSTPLETIVAYKDKNSLGKFFAQKTQQLQEYAALTKTVNGVKSVSFVAQQYQGNPQDDKKGTKIYYIQFKRLLEWIEENLVPVSENNGKKSRFIKFDTDVESNLILLPSLSVSTDPRICNFDSFFKFSNYPDETFSTLKRGDNFTVSVGKNKYGKLMNIYFSMDWILTTMDSIVNDNGDVVLMDFLNALLRGFESTTGSYNTLSPDVDPDTNTIIFRDETAVPERKELTSKEPTAFFNTFGYNVDGGSNFVRNLNFNTTVTPNLATMITVGATRDGYSPGYDATGLRSINYGTYDAIKPKLTNNSGQPITGSSSDDKLKELEEKYKEASTNASKYIQGLTNYGGTYIFDPDAANAYSSTIKNLIEYKQIKSTKENPNKKSGSPTLGFIPFDLGLDIDGLSGIKIYNKIAVETSFLPYNYPETLEFVVKGVDHSISQNTWQTSLTTLAIPKNPYGSGKAGNDLKSNNTEDSGGRRSNNPPPTSPTSNEAKQRAVLTRILDDGTQTLGYLDVYDETGSNILYTLTTVELPYKGNKNGESAIPTGEYFIKSRNNVKYGQHFHIVGSKEGNFEAIPGSNNTNRTWVLIHRAPQAPGWLAGCIGPSFTYNFNNTNALGNPNGIGTKYLNPAKSQSVAAQAKLVGTLYNVGGFKMEIKNAQSTLPTKFSDPSIQALKKEPRLAALFKTGE